MGRSQARQLQLQLQVEVTPWVGNLLLHSESCVSSAELLGQRAEQLLLSTPLFQLLLQVMTVDSAGCRETVEKRRSKRSKLAPARPSGSAPVRLKNPKTIGGMLQRRALEAESQHGLILEQLGAGPRLPQPRPQPRPQLLLHIPPRLPPAVFLPPPLRQTPPTPSIRLLSSPAPPPAAPPPPLTLPSPPAPPPAPRVNAASLNCVRIVPPSPSPTLHPPTPPTLRYKTSSTHTPTSLLGRPAPVPICTQISPAPSQLGATCTGSAPSPSGSAHTGPAPTPSSPQRCSAAGGGPKVVGGAEAVGGRRPRKLTAKARVLQEAAAAKVTPPLPPPAGGGRSASRQNLDLC